MFYNFDLTDEQKVFIDAIKHYKMVICNAPAGSGKTQLALGTAKILVQKGELEKCYFIVNPTEERKMGYRPGNQTEKEMSYLAPLFDALPKINEDQRCMHFEQGDLARQSAINAKNGHVWLYPKTHIFMRGTNIEDCIAICDESQNYTINDLRKVLTRVHDSAKIVLIGHTGQIDLPDENLSGFSRVIEHFKDEPYCKTCTLTKNFRGEVATHADKMR